MHRQQLQYRHIGHRVLSQHLSGRRRHTHQGEFEYENEFHAIYNWFNSFGYCERILRNFNPEEVKQGVLLRSKWDPGAKRLHVQRAIGGVAEDESWSSQRLYTLSRMGKLLAEAGPDVEIVYGSLGCEPYHRGSRRMIVIARRVI